MENNNRTLAEFLGWKVSISNRSEFVHVSDKEVVSIDRCEFHTNWNWIIQVVRKVKSLNIEEYHLIDDIDDALLQTDIMLVLDACVKFIDWYKFTGCIKS